MYTTTEQLSYNCNKMYDLQFSNIKHFSIFLMTRSNPSNYKTCHLEVKGSEIFNSLVVSGWEGVCQRLKQRTKLMEKDKKD